MSAENYANKTLVNIVKERPQFWQLLERFSSEEMALVYALSTGVITPGFECSIEEIAQILNCNVLQVKKTLLEAKKNILQQAYALHPNDVRDVLLCYELKNKTKA